MSNINLLPWREVIKERQRKNFFKLMFIFFVAGAIIAILFFFALDMQISRQNSRNSQWENEIKVVDQKIAEIEKLKQRRQELIERMQSALCYSGIGNGGHSHAALGYAGMIVVEHLTGSVPWAHTLKCSTSDGPVSQGKRTYMSLFKYFVHCVISYDPF